MVGALEGNQLQRMLDIEARANATSTANRGSAKRPLPPGGPTAPAPASKPSPPLPTSPGIYFRCYPSFRRLS